jgi:hypothetical protein
VDKELLNEDQQREYLASFWSTVEPIIDKQVLRNRSMRTKTSVRELNDRSHRLGKKYEYTFKNGKKSLVFSVDISPWLWTDGSVKMQVELIKTKNLVVPRRKIEDRTPDPMVYRPDTSSKYWFFEALEPMSNYLKVIELTPLDVGLFDNVEAALKNILKK